MEAMQQAVNQEHLLRVGLRPGEFTHKIVEEDQDWLGSAELFVLDGAEIIPPGGLPATLRANQKRFTCLVMGNDS